MISNTFLLQKSWGILSNFGQHDLDLIIFIPVFCLLVLLSYKTIFSERSDVNEIECILFSMAIPSLLVSGSLWVSWNFWMWFALAVKQHVCLLRNYSQPMTVTRFKFKKI